MKLIHMIYIGLFAALLSILSLLPPIPLPFSPVPITFQVLGIFIVSGLLTPKISTMTVLVYLLLGGIGIPVFAGGTAGVGVLLGPTGGYLLGFIPATFLSSSVLRHYKTPKTQHYIFAFSLGLIGIYLPGTLQLSAVTGLSLDKALTVGSLPYIPLDFIKIIMATWITKSLARHLKTNT
ncbi:biotin transporter BioY [Fusibacter tunisiensis]|uniref:Biotin transporter n=1 Tax=Fusibacter tunisiensis TaxID=1008308 RepID=A0ABS2MNT4_9FIRM|nr:biotin transporter BioY [Fusibacter tunisiensis]MBM7561050.1 biotin transport system substrate-specific component [Fusibacter tunisiensis]